MMFIRNYSLLVLWLSSYRHGVLAAEIAAAPPPSQTIEDSSHSPQTVGTTSSTLPTMNVPINLSFLDSTSASSPTSSVVNPLSSTTISIPDPASSAANAECSSNIMSIGLTQVSRTGALAPSQDTAIVMTINESTYNMLIDINERETYLITNNFENFCNISSCQVNQTVGKDEDGPSRPVPFQQSQKVSTNITIGNITFENFPLWVLSDQAAYDQGNSSAFNSSLFSGLDGVIGLDFGSTFLDASARKCGTDDSYGLYLGRTQVPEDNSTAPYVPRTLIVGGYDTYKTNLTSGQEFLTNNLNVSFTLNYNKSLSDGRSVSKTPLDMPLMATIDSLATWNWLPSQIYNQWPLGPMNNTVNVNVNFTDFSMEPIELDGNMFRGDPSINHAILGQPFLAHAYLVRSDSTTLWNVVNSTSTTNVHQQVFGSPPPTSSSNPASPSSSVSGSSNHHSSIVGALVGGILGGLLGLILIVITCLCLLRRRRRNKNRQSRESMQPMRTRGSGIFNDNNMSYPPILPPPPSQPSDNINNINTTTTTTTTTTTNNDITNNNPFMYQQANHNASTTSEIRAKTMEMSPIVHTRQERESNGGGGDDDDSDEEGDVNDIDADRRSLVSEPYHEGISPVQPRNSMGMTSLNAPRLPFSRVSATALDDGGSGAL